MKAPVLRCIWRAWSLFLVPALILFAKSRCIPPIPESPSCTVPPNIRRSVAIRLQKSGEHRHWLPLFSFLACLFICIWLVSMSWTPHWDYESPLDMITGDSPSPLSLSLDLWHLLASSIRRTIHSAPLSASDPPLLSLLDTAWLFFRQSVTSCLPR